MSALDLASRDPCLHGGFLHEALLYAGADDFVRSTAPFIREGLETGEPVLVMVGAAKIELLREELIGDAGEVAFADMGQVGHNPARIIPAWREFAARHQAPGARLRGIGEPIWAGRGSAELVEAQRHESLLNLAFADARGLRLLCPYDVDALSPDVIEEAHRSHPFMVERGARRASEICRSLEAVAAPFADPLPPSPPEACELKFSRAAELWRLRRLVARHAEQADLSEMQTEDFVLVANEVATNTLRHSGDVGVLRLWSEPGALLCEITDGGRLDQPLAGRERPAPGQAGGHGLWLANQLCDLVQLRCTESGSVVRLHMRRA